MKTPHVHAALIKQWADGATIEVAIPKDHDSALRGQFDSWMITKTPEWISSKQYRVKPEPKPDVVMYCCIEKKQYSDGLPCASVSWVTNANPDLLKTDNVMFVFDGETGDLKSAQVLARV